ncbi:ATP-grasp domain-containing protein [Phytomonospora sp. NPDC050363]|uniref:ATP-grasp domain-containing protein n=1 Tax=Phytomonospora sp. NPDC050363 TaxID=3155642 RepID=UPI0033EFB54A
MRSSLVFVESNTTGTGMLALAKSRDLGLRPVLVTGRPGRYRGLSDVDAEVIVCDTNDTGEIADRLDATELAGITTTSEYYLPAAAELAAKFGVPGNPPGAARRCRDKAAVRAALSGAGIGQPRWAVASAAGEVAGAVAEVGLPCVVKPVDESGSSGVRLCSTLDEARTQAAALLAVTRNVRDQPSAGLVLFEEYVDGREFSVELFGHAGVTSCVGITEKTVVGEPWFVEAGHVFPASLDGPDAAAIVSAVREAVAVLGIGLGATHTEVRLTERGPVLIEINARAAGGMIPELVRLATGVDLLEQQLRAAAGLPVRLDPTRAGHAGIAFLLSPGDGVLTSVSGAAEARAVPGVERVTLTTEPGSRVHPARDAYHRLGHVIAAGRDPRAVGESLGLAKAAIAVHIEQGDRST